MPTYEYECEKCGHCFELFQSMSDEPRKRCPKLPREGAGAESGRAPGMIFTGSGFYSPTTRSDSYKEAQKKIRGFSSRKGSAQREARGGGDPKRSRRGWKCRILSHFL